MYQQYSSPPTVFHPFRDVEPQLRDQTQDFVTAFNTANYDHAARLFADDGVLMAPRYEGAYGQRHVELLLRELGETGYGDLRMETMRVDHSGDTAVEFGRFSLVMRKDDGTMIPERGKYVRVWRRLGAWLLMADCWNWTSQAAGDRAA